MEMTDIYIYVTRLHTRELLMTSMEKEAVLMKTPTREVVGEEERGVYNVSGIVRNKSSLAENLLNGWCLRREVLFLMEWYRHDF